MKHLGINNIGSLLMQEAHLTNNTLRSSFDLLLKANLYQEREGFFYSAFFHLTIGLERFLKLFMVTNHMLNNNYVAPTEKELKNYGHNLLTLYTAATENLNEFSDKNSLHSSALLDREILNFLSEYAIYSRYYNLNELNNAIYKNHPLEEWLKICNRIYEEYISSSRRSKITQKIFYDLDKTDNGNGYSYHLSFDGHPLTIFDIQHTQLIIKKSSPLVIWRIIELFQPIYMKFYTISENASIAETGNLIIPHLEEFFPFFFLSKEQILKRKKWLLFS